MVTRDPWLRALVVVMLLIAGVYLSSLIWQLAVQFADIILLFFLAWVIAFILEPLVMALQNIVRLPRAVAVLSAYVTVLFIAAIAVLQLVPRLTSQVIQLTADLPIYVAWMNGELLKLQSLLARQGVLIAPESLITYQEVSRHVESLGPQLLANTVGVATGAANLLFQVVIVLILSYYMTADGHRITAALLFALPAVYRDDARYFFASVNRAFGGFMRGQLAMAAIYGVGTAIVMTAAGLSPVLLPSVAAAIFFTIPFLGPILSMVLPLIVAAVSRPDTFWVLLVVLFVLQAVVLNVVAPRVMSQTVGMHPLLVFVGFLGGAKVAGVWGAVFGVPIVGVATAMVLFYRATLEDRNHLRETAPQLVGEPTAEDEAASGADPAAGGSAGLPGARSQVAAAPTTVESPGAIAPTIRS